jgi:hypothetical protein
MANVRIWGPYTWNIPTLWQPDTYWYPEWYPPSDVDITNGTITFTAHALATTWEISSTIDVVETRSVKDAYNHYVQCKIFNAGPDAMPAFVGYVTLIQP